LTRNENQNRRTTKENHIKLTIYIS
jgi:hypothetical protein